MALDVVRFVSESRPSSRRYSSRWPKIALSTPGFTQLISGGNSMTIRPHAPEWYDRLSTLQQGYFYPWKSQLAPRNGEDTFLDVVHQYLAPTTDVLDVGCGHGAVALELSPHCRSILAYDRVERYIQLAREAAQKIVSRISRIYVSTHLQKPIMVLPEFLPSLDLLT